MRVPRRMGPTLTTRRLDQPGMWPVGQQTAPETRKPLPRELGEGLGTSGVHLKAEAETRPDWHDRVKGALLAVLRLGSLSSSRVPSVFSTRGHRPTGHCPTPPRP